MSPINTVIVGSDSDSYIQIIPDDFSEQKQFYYQCHYHSSMIMNLGIMTAKK